MNADLSLRVSKTMDYFGYGAQQREFRTRAYGLMDSSLNMCLNEVSFITVGSKGEGITNLYESDNDVLMLFRSAFCVERNSHPSILPSQTTVLVANTDLCYHGHTFLEVVRLGTESFHDCCLPLWSKNYISSSVFSRIVLASITNNYSFSHQIVGPALNLKVFKEDFDVVPVLPYYCPSLLQDWSDRPRFHNWPSPELRQKVVSLGAVVAPTSHTTSFIKGLEWRICFNAGETALVKSFCDTQIKLYILLKAVKKDVLKPESKEITSYVMKNIVFWLAENNPTEDFHTGTLVDWVFKALGFLYQAVKYNMLPYYMIPKRNLLAGKMEPHQRDTMLTRLGDALRSGSALLFQCGRLGRALTTVNPDRLVVLGNSRNELEMLLLTIHTRAQELKQPNMTLEEVGLLIERDNIIKKCTDRWADIVLPGSKQLEQFGVDVDTIIVQRMQSLLT